jgi:protein required for attachment to host cells
MTSLKRKRLWVVVADGSHARILGPQDVEGRFATLTELAPAERTAYPPDLRQEPHEVDKLQYAASIAHRLTAEAERGAYDQLVLVAPGHVLHALRDALGKPAATRLVGTLSKELTKFPDHEISPHLATWWVAPEAAA